MKKGFPAFRNGQGTASLVQLGKPQSNQILPFRLGGNHIQILRLNILAPAEQAQNIDLSHGEEHAKITSSQIPANAETVLAPLPAQEQFRRLFPALCGTPLTAPT